MDKKDYIKNFLHQAENISSSLQFDEKHEHNFIKTTLKVAGNLYDSELTAYVFSFVADNEKNAGVMICGLTKESSFFRINIYSNQPNICRTQIGNSEKPKRVSPLQAVNRLSKFISNQTGK